MLLVTALARGDESGPRDVRGDALGIASEQRPAGHCGMCSDQEAGQDLQAGSAGTTVLGVRVASEENGRVGDILDLHDRSKCELHGFEPREPR